jgi:ubiquinone/menaquinone biosynthesis C-methylase UbiE
MALITIEDFRDIYLKSVQRGLPFLMSKLSPSGKSRTKSSFNETDIRIDTWSMIPMVRKRCNLLITGDEEMTYETYLSEKIIPEKQNIRMLSIGSGVCSHEIRLAKLNPHWDVTCLDFSDRLIQEAAQTASDEGLHNMHFMVEDIYAYPLPENGYDLVFFNESLHHFKNMEAFLRKIHHTIKPSGWLVMNEYVGANRMIYPNHQIKAINRGLSLIDKPYRKMFCSNLFKNHYYGSGRLRMIISDPSECVESEQILPSVHKLFSVRVEKGYGGNILMPLLKDLSHHFLECDEERMQLLQQLFDYEDHYLQTYPSDFVFGVYEK